MLRPPRGTPRDSLRRAASQPHVTPQLSARGAVRAVAASIAVAVGTTAFTIIRLKMMAVALPLREFGVYALFVALQAAAATLLLLGLGPSLTRAIARAGADRAAATRLIATATTIALLTTVVAAATITLMARDFARVALGDERYETVVLILAMTLPFTICASLAAFALHGLGALRAYMWSTVAAALFVSAAAGPLAVAYGLEGAALGTLVGTAVGALVYVVVVAIAVQQIDAVRASSQSVRSALRELGPTGVAAFAVAILTSLNPYFIRSVIGHSIGLDAVAMFHAGALPSASVAAALLNGLNWLLFAPLAASAADPGRVHRLQNAGLRWGMLGMLPVAWAVIAVRQPLLVALFSPQLADAASVLPVLVLADLMYVVEWTLLVALLAVGRLRLYVAIEGVRTIALLVLAPALAGVLGLFGAASGYLLSVVLAVAIAASRRSAGVPVISRANAVLLGWATASVAAVWVASEAGAWSGVAAGLVVLALTVRLVLTQDERTGAYRAARTGAARLRFVRRLNIPLTSALRAVLGRGAASSDSLPRYLPRVGPVRHRLPNGALLRLDSRGDDLVTSIVFWRGPLGYEPETSPLFYRLAARARCTVDVGAHVGVFALLAAHANPRGTVIALEPLDRVYERLTRNVRLNGVTNVRCLPLAAGAREGTADFFHASAMTVPSASGLSYDMIKDNPAVAATPVRVVRLDGELARMGISPVDLLKMDTEGTEPDVVEGASAMIARDRPHIICEVLVGAIEAPRRLEALLAPLGYRFFLLGPEGLLAQEHITPDPRMRWRNFLFTTANAADLA